MTGVQTCALPMSVDQKIKKVDIDVVGEGRSAKIDVDSKKAKQYLKDFNDNRIRANDELKKSKPKGKKKTKPKTIKQETVENLPEKIGRTT